MLYPYLFKVYDQPLVGIKAEEIINGDLDCIENENIVEIIKLFGELPVIEEMKEEQKDILENKLSIKEEHEELYNIMLLENEKLSYLVKTVED